MKEDNELMMMCGFACGTSEVTPPSAEPLKALEAGSAPSPVRKKAQPGGGTSRDRRPVVAFLIGSLLLMLAMVAAPAPSAAGVHVGIFVNFGPPALPVYEQPPCPAPGYIWTPGYWAWDPAYGYYWVPGTWVAAPFIGAMWTPGYWDYDDGGYRWHGGFWGLSVGWYGGIDYGFGYNGDGYHGGYWDHDRFYYNRAVNRLEGRDFSHVYYRRGFRHFGDRRTSYHGGPGGVRFGPTRQQLAASRGRRFGPVRQQIDQRRFARRDPGERARMNHGRPQIAATRRPGSFRGNGVTYARRAGAPYRAPVQRMHGRGFQHSAPQRFGNNSRGFRSFRSPHNAPVQRMHGRGFQHSARQRFGNNSRGFRSFRSPHNTRNFSQRGYRAPVQRRNIHRPVYRNNQHAFARFQRRPAPQEMRRFRGHAAPQRHSSPPRGHWNGGNRHGGGHGHGHGGRH